MKDQMKVANTIRDQIANGQTVDGAEGWKAMMCWGVSTLTGMGQSEKDHGALSFAVNGAKFKGHVKVRLMFNDTYTVEFWKCRSRTIKMVKYFDTVYFDELTSIIDSYVEYAEAS